ncbi:MAG: hypothetical protein KDJ80_02000 [Nitratireductor sp.]|nr:hypothetical protein [Nitratireductor sp.]
MNPFTAFEQINGCEEAVILPVQPHGRQKAIQPAIQPERKFPKANTAEIRLSSPGHFPRRTFLGAADPTVSSLALQFGRCWAIVGPTFLQRKRKEAHP